jgi:integrase
MTGRERAILYILAVNTGLRASELASLTWQSFNLNSPTPSVTVLAAYSKHRRDDTLPLRKDIAEQLTAWKDELNPENQSRVFSNFRPHDAAEIFKQDLQVAGIEYRDAANRVADFHSLRHTFISNLHKGGVSPKVAQSLARHSTISLTMDTYTHLGLLDERAALDSLPALPSIESKNDKQDTGKAVA